MWAWHCAYIASATIIGTVCFTKKFFRDVSTFKVESSALLKITVYYKTRLCKNFADYNSWKKHMPICKVCSREIARNELYPGLLVGPFGDSKSLLGPFRASEIHFWPFLNHFLTLFGTFLEPFWTLFGPFFGPFWTLFEFFLPRFDSFLYNHFDHFWQVLTIFGSFLHPFNAYVFGHIWLSVLFKRGLIFPQLYWVSNRKCKEQSSQSS